MRLLSFLPLLPFLMVSCQTTSVEDEFADFEPKASTVEQSAEAKAIKMFASYDPGKVSNFDGKEFKGKEANLRSTFETKDAFKVHPYFKLRENKDMADKVYRKTAAREGNTSAAAWQGKKDSWFKRTFAKKSASDRDRQIAKEDASIPESARNWHSERSYYEGKEYHRKFEPMDDPNRSKKLTRSALRSLLNTQ